jgi:hypothetical protein
VPASWKRVACGYFKGEVGCSAETNLALLPDGAQSCSRCRRCSSQGPRGELSVSGGSHSLIATAKCWKGETLLWNFLPL